MRKSDRSKTYREDCSNPRGFGKIKTYAIKAVKSIALAIGCITASVVVSVPTVQAAIRDGVSTTNQSASQGLPNKSRTPVRHGKLILRNDTESGSLIFLHAPGGDSFTRYAYVPSCTTIEMSAKYSTEWRTSSDTVHLHNIVMGEGGVLEVTRSFLSNHRDKTACNEEIRAKAQRVAAALSSTNTGDVENPTSYAQQVTNLVGLFDDVGKWGKKGLPLFKGQLDEGISAASTTAKKAVQLDEAVRKVNTRIDELMEEVINRTRRKVNVQDQEELRLVADYLKGDGTDLASAAKRLEQYLKDCTPVFASKVEAQQVLATLQYLQNLMHSYEKKLSPLRAQLANQQGQISLKPLPASLIVSINEKLNVDQPNPKMSSLGIECVRDLDRHIPQTYSF